MTTLRELYQFIYRATFAAGPSGLSEAALSRFCQPAARPATVAAVIQTARRRGHLVHRDGRVYGGYVPYMEVRHDYHRATPAR